MKATRRSVFVPSKAVKFPSSCPSCLRKTDLTSYKSKWQTTSLKDPLTKVTEKHEIKIPICKSCKSALLKKARIFSIKLFGISAVICWGILSVILAFNVNLWGAGDLGALIFIGLALPPLYFFYLILRPSGEIDWPVELQSPNMFSFENENYAILFERANSASAQFGSKI